MATYPLPTLAPTIDSTGISAPSYNDILLSLQASFQQIYGSDIYIAADSQDGQWIAVIAKAINDSNQATITVFQNFSPAYAQGAGLSSLVKLNGLNRGIATNSTAVGNVVGQVGTVIANGVVKDINGNLWNLPASVTIPTGGTISVTVTAQTVGAIAADIGQINSIYNPQYGWQSFTNTSAATQGNPVEADSALRLRQAVSTALPATNTIESIYSAIGNITGVIRFTVFENSTGTTDSNGLPAHSFAVVVLGGAVVDIATAIQLKKPPGIQTYGTTSYTVYDSFGLPVPINFFELTLVPIYVDITIHALPGYVATTGTAVINTLVDYLNSLSIGETVYYNRLFSPANLNGSSAQLATGLTQAQLDALSNTYSITALTIGTAPNPAGTTDITIPFNEAAQGIVANITLTVA